MKGIKKSKKKKQRRKSDQPRVLRAMHLCLSSTTNKTCREKNCPHLPISQWERQENQWENFPEITRSQFSFDSRPEFFPSYREVYHPRDLFPLRRNVHTRIILEGNAKRAFFPRRVVKNRESSPRSSGKR